MNQKQKAEQTAAKRMQYIMPLLVPELDPARLIALKKQQALLHHISYRSISRYYENYLKEDFEGLKPKTPVRKTATVLPDNYDLLVEQAVLLRRECPTRSVQDLIRILELEGRVKPGKLKRSTLQHALQKNGYGARQMQMYTAKGSASRRCNKQHRCQLYQGDIKYGPYLPIGPNGSAKQVYLAAFIDDATRYLVAAKFYDNQKVEIIEDSLRTAIMTGGKPEAIFVDNGRQYRSEWLKKACGKLGIKLLFSRPYHPEGKGKIEAFNRRMNAFISEIALEKPQTLAELNEKLDLWVEHYYHTSPHYGLEGRSPLEAFRGDSRPLCFADEATLREAFLHTQEREVDKTGCLSFNGSFYEAGLQFIGRKVEVYYDPTWREEIEIHARGQAPFKVKRLEIGPNCKVHKEAVLPAALPVEAPKSSRLLQSLAKGRTRKKAPLATSYKRLEEVSGHV